MMRKLTFLLGGLLAYAGGVQAQCVYETITPTSGGSNLLSQIRFQLVSGNCTPTTGTLADIDRAYTSSTNTYELRDIVLYIKNDVVIDANLELSNNKTAIIVGKDPAIVNGNLTTTNVAASVTEAANNNYTFSAPNGQQGDNSFVISPLGLLSVNILSANKGNILIEANRGSTALNSQIGVLEIGCNIVLRNNVILTVDGRLNILGNLDLTGATGSATIIDTETGNGSPGGSGVRVGGSVYGSDVINDPESNSSTGVNVTFCVLNYQNGATQPTGCSAPVGATPNTNYNSDAACAASVLPVELVRFSAVPSAKRFGVDVSWTTASEKNNSHFEIERSADGVTYQKIGRVTGAGNALNVRQYSFEDTRPLAGTSYYRLRQVDFDGTASYSQVVVVNNSSQQVHLTPNPATSQLGFEYAGGELQWRIVNSVGQLMKKGSAQASSSVDVSSLRAGVYFFEVTTGGQRSVQKFFKQD
ncbi:T9SS C-terminal target domain-containing protein [Hymenobacter oligotrophus]|uniref:T9SS C-terminal target domain-containing protein n=1 Tax=Hymenobacter oligotrophus TaxID=2319843 RepID=A0A3B7QZJ9_9BACT|nr:T9SS type A sorting domain-containing protein [Hymenobacter oligotrophus]AYA38658.1 T9SS C-terminal target domain-containing protein [Hymenobacter oligotrophus]